MLTDIGGTVVENSVCLPGLQLLLNVHTALVCGYVPLKAHAAWHRLYREQVHT